MPTLFYDPSVPELHYLEGGVLTVFDTLPDGVQQNIDHGNLLGLLDDDHTQYSLLAGRSGGQTLIGGIGSGDDLILQSTSHATRGHLIFGSGSLRGLFDESKGNIILNVSSTAALDITRDGNPYSGPFITTYGDTVSPGPTTQFRRGRGTRASTSAVQTSNVLGGARFQGHDGSANGADGFTATTSTFEALADENFTGSAQGTSLQIQTTPIGSISRAVTLTASGSGNMLIGAATIPSTGSGGLILPDGTALSGMATNTAGFYAEDDTGTVKPVAIDEADSTAILTPHNQEIMDRLSSDKYPGGNIYIQPYLGIKRVEDITRALRLLENLTGEKLIFDIEISKKDWRVNQELNFNKMRTRYELWEKHRDEFISSEEEPTFTEQAPMIPIVKDPPKWLFDRLEVKPDLTNLKNQLNNWKRERNL